MKSSPVTQLKKFEEKARQIRRRAGIADDSPINAKELASSLGYGVVETAELLGADQPSVDASQFSGMALPDRKLIVVNSNQTSERKQSTIMEEVAHLELGHQAEDLGAGITPSRHRYSEEDETEAYWVGSACLLPARFLAAAVFAGDSISSIAVSRGVSRELVEFRLKTLRLWKRRRDKDSVNAA